MFHLGWLVCSSKRCTIQIPFGIPYRIAAYPLCMRQAILTLIRTRVPLQHLRLYGIASQREELLLAPRFCKPNNEQGSLKYNVKCVCER